jgi:cytochrome c oxidase cbb3-type subunit 4
MLSEMIDSTWFRSAGLILMMLAFLGIWGWAWSRNRKETFDHASRLPLEEDDGQIPQDNSNAETTKE